MRNCAIKNECGAPGRTGRKSWKNELNHKSFILFLDSNHKSQIVGKFWSWINHYENDLNQFWIKFKSCGKMICDWKKSWKGSEKDSNKINFESNWKYYSSFETPSLLPPPPNEKNWVRFDFLCGALLKFVSCTSCIMYT